MKSSPQAALSVLRLALGALLLTEGYQKFALSDLSGVAATLGALDVPLPGAVAPVLAVSELLGGALIMAGVATRPLAGVLGLTAVVQSLLPLAFSPPGPLLLGQVKYPLLLLACALAVVLGSQSGRAQP